MNYARLTNVTTGSNRFCKINLAHFTKLFLQHKNNGHHLKLVWKNLPILSANCYNVTTFKVNWTFQDNFVYTDPMIGYCNDKNIF